MKLIYRRTLEVVCVGDEVIVRGEPHVVEFFAAPHKPDSEGKITLRPADEFPNTGHDAQYYVSIVDAMWVEREDRV